MTEKSMWRKYKNGEITDIEYRNEISKEKGFNTYSEYISHKNHLTGKHKPMSENKGCPSYLGVYIAERVLSKVFKNVKRMSTNNVGYDFICGKGFKIDVKSSCYRNIEGEGKSWLFNIKKNTIADYFLLLAFDNRKDLNPLHVWLIKGKEILDIKLPKKLNERDILFIFDTSRSIKYYGNFELKDKLSKVLFCCDNMKR